MKLTDYITEHISARINQNNTLLLEGGAAGHMKHPFDLPGIDTGKALIKFFEDVTAALKKDEKTFIKIDGLNASVRLNDNNEFVLDRGSMKPLDIKGVTKDDLVDRFGAGHGFIIAGGTVLDIFNEALPGIQTELRQLGMLSNHNRMLNMEYVEGKTNVIDTDKKFIAVHGLIEMEQVTPKRRASKEISYNKIALNSLVKKVNEVAQKYDFQVYSQFLAILDSTPNYSKVLQEKLSINIGGSMETHSLQEWLMTMKPISRDAVVMSTTKGKVDAISKYVMLQVWSDVDIYKEFREEEKDTVIAGFLMYYATMRLGAELLKCINSDLGRGDTQEGIVIRNKNLTGIDGPVKITGEFIIKGMESTFRK